MGFLTTTMTGAMAKAREEVEPSEVEHVRVLQREGDMANHWMVECASFGAIPVEQRSDLAILRIVPGLVSVRLGPHNVPARASGSISWSIYEHSQ